MSNQTVKDIISMILVFLNSQGEFGSREARFVFDLARLLGLDKRQISRLREESLQIVNQNEGKGLKDFMDLLEGRYKTELGTLLFERIHHGLEDLLGVSVETEEDSLSPGEIRAMAIMEHAYYDCAFKLGDVPFYVPMDGSLEYLLDFAPEPVQADPGEDYAVYFPYLYRAIQLEDDVFLEINAYTYNVLTTAGVEGSSDVKIYFSEEVESIVVHDVSVVTAGESYRVDREDITIYQLGDSDHKKVLSKTWCICMILNHLQTGSHVRVSYSRIRRLRKFDGLYSDIYLSKSDAVGVFRVVYALQSGSQVKENFLFEAPEEFAYERVKAGDRLIHRWDANIIKELDFDDNTLSFTELTPCLWVSSIPHWADFSQWMKRRCTELQMPPTEFLPEELRVILTEDSLSLKSRVAKICDWVRLKINYFSVTLDDSGYIPRSPELVLKKGWGDCKDKSNLLKELLARIGVSSYLALVNTGRLGSEPVPLAGFFFDHCVLWIELDDDQYMVDTTQNMQIDYMASAGCVGSTLFLVDHPDKTFQIVPEREELISDFEVSFKIDLRKGQKAEIQCSRFITGPATADYVPYIGSDPEAIHRAGKEYCMAHLGCDLEQLEAEVQVDGITVIWKASYQSENLIRSGDEGDFLQLDSYHLCKVVGSYFDQEKRSDPLLIYPCRIRMDLEVHVQPNGGESWKTIKEAVENDLIQLANVIEARDHGLYYRTDATLKHAQITASEYDELYPKVRDFLMKSGCYFPVVYKGNWWARNWWLPVLVLIYILIRVWISYVR